jgi:hypothetical protein
MSHLRVVWPDEECPSEDDDGTLMTAVVPFYLEPRRRSLRMDVITRAQTLFSNRTCPHCQYALVKPIELDDAVVNRSGLPIPGTATLVGFHCMGCDTEWGV